MTIQDTEICPTLEAGAGEGGNNLPMVLDTLVFDAAQCTRPTTGMSPAWGNKCYALTKEASRLTVIIKYAGTEDTNNTE